jgi:hypothetical protein
MAWRRSLGSQRKSQAPNRPRDRPRACPRRSMCPCAASTVGSRTRTSPVAIRPRRRLGVQRCWVGGSSRASQHGVVSTTCLHTLPRVVEGFIRRAHPSRRAASRLFTLRMQRQPSPRRSRRRPRHHGTQPRHGRCHPRYRTCAWRDHDRLFRPLVKHGMVRSNTVLERAGPGRPTAHHDRVCQAWHRTSEVRVLAPGDRGAEG